MYIHIYIYTHEVVEDVADVTKVRPPFFVFFDGRKE
jgi:hypothetical protein